MHPTANPFLLLLITSTSSYLNCIALQYQDHHHGAGGCIPDERAALLSFKKGIDGDPSNLLTSWRGKDCCRWRGIRCSNQTGHVLELRLRNPNPSIDSEQGCADENSLFGEISPSLLSLEHLEHMDLSMNCLRGRNSSTLPEFFGSMHNLRYLNLSGIEFTGRIPPQLSKLSRLQYLDVGQHGHIEMYSVNLTWLASLPLLQYVSMTNVNLSRVTDWPHVLNTIPSLRVIRLSGCSLQSANQSLPYLNLTKLEKLDLSWNNIDHPIASSWFWKATSLKYLNLGGNRLFGRFPDTLGNMTSLRVLDASANNLNKDFMMTGNLKKLCSLEVLDLTSNDINRDMAVLMEGLPHCAWKILKELRLSTNSFTGTLSNLIGKFTSLRVLDISNNNVTGRIPPEVRHLTSLVKLDLSNNHLSGTVPAGIGALTNLASFNLRNNKFSGIIREEHFAGLTSLKDIDLSSNSLKVVVDSNWLPPFRLESALFAFCQMGPLFPSWLQWQLEITKLDFSSASIIGKIPDWFWSSFLKVTYLDLSHNKISGSLPAQLDALAFEQLNLSSNYFTGAIPPLPRNITVFDISNNAFSGTLPSDLDAPQLQTLLMYSNQIVGSIPQSICKLQDLTDLDLSGNLLSGEIPQCSDMESIEFLLLSNNSLSGKFPAFLQNCTGLRFLDLAWNNLFGSLPAWIGEMINLQFLRLSHNFFSGNIPIEITNLMYLQYLDLSDNNISGAIPWNLSNLTGMTAKGFMPIHSMMEGPSGLGSTTVTGQFGEILSIITKGQQLTYGGTLAYFVSFDLSGNSITGEIPPDITSLDALINLNLSSNRLRGNIPLNIGTLQSLESLDLSKNKLSGEIPMSLSSLTSLSYMNMSYNNLSGSIPSGRQLDTLNVDNPSLIYIGNDGLCGPPLQKNCSGSGAIDRGYSISRKQRFEPISFDFGIVLGLVAGHWMVFCALLFNKTWRIACFRLVDKLYD